MKGKIKQTRDRIVDYTKSTWDFIKEHPKEIIMVVGLGAGGYLLDKLTPRANAAQIKVRNVSWNEPQRKYDEFSQTISKTGDFYNEKFLTSEDNSHADDPTYILDAYTKEQNDPNLIGVNSKKQNTPGWNVYFEADIFITGPMSNDIEIIVVDANGLEHRKVIAYDVNNPSDFNEIPKDGTLFWKSLPPITSQPAGEYANWFVATPPIVPGDSAGPNETGKFEIGKLDGQNDYFDIKTISSQWLQTTEEGENYLEGDLNFDRIVNFKDFAIPAGYWWKTEDGNLISKLTTPALQGKYLKTFQEAMAKHFYGEDKVKPTRVAYLVMLPKKQRNNYGGIIPQLASKEQNIERKLQTPNNHQPTWARNQYLDDKLKLTKNYKAPTQNFSINTKQYQKRPAA